MSRVVLLHGVVSSGANMRGLAAALGLTDVASPDGPEPFDMGPGRQWFSVRGITETNRPARIAAALPGFRAMVQSFGPVEETVLIGFSQGAIMALHAVADGLPVKAVFALSGRLAGPVPARGDWPPITLVHGRQDGVIPAQMAQATEAWLREAGAAPDLHLFDGLAHGVDDRCLAVLRAGLAPA
jgi:phospholipase/carboxylesterase